MITQPQVLYLNSNEVTDLDFLLPITNEYHNVKVISNQRTYKDGVLVDTKSVLPIICTIPPSTKISELSCKRFFISKIIHRIKLQLVRKYKFFFSIKTVKELHLNIRKDLDVFDSNKYTTELSGKLIVEYTKKDLHNLGYDKNYLTYTEEFEFNVLSVFGNIELSSSTTLPPMYWNIVKDNIHIPKFTKYNFKDNLITFNVGDKVHTLDIDTKVFN